MEKVEASEVQAAISSMSAALKSLMNANEHLYRALKNPTKMSTLEARLLIETRAILRACETLLGHEPDLLSDVLEENNGTPQEPLRQDT